MPQPRERDDRHPHARRADRRRRPRGDGRRDARAGRCRSRLGAGTVTAIAEVHDELVRLEVDGVPCIAYPRVTGAVEVGDDVLVNVQARELGLGSGGFDILHANLTRGLELEPEPGAHVMTLPYTSLQHAVRHGEEDALGETLVGNAGRLLLLALAGRARVCRARRARRGVRAGRRRRASRFAVRRGAGASCAAPARIHGRRRTVRRRRRAGGQRLFGARVRQRRGVPT